MPKELVLKSRRFIGGADGQCWREDIYGPSSMDLINSWHIVIERYDVGKGMVKHELCLTEDMVNNDTELETNTMPAWYVRPEPYTRMDLADVYVSNGCGNPIPMITAPTVFVLEMDEGQGTVLFNFYLPDEVVFVKPHSLPCFRGKLEGAEKVHPLLKQAMTHRNDVRHFSPPITFYNPVEGNMVSICCTRKGFSTGWHVSPVRDVVQHAFYNPLADGWALITLEKAGAMAKKGLLDTLSKQVIQHLAACTE